MVYSRNGCYHRTYYQVYSNVSLKNYYNVIWQILRKQRKKDNSEDAFQLMYKYVRKLKEEDGEFQARPNYI